MIELIIDNGLLATIPAEICMDDVSSEFERSFNVGDPEGIIWWRVSYSDTPGFHKIWISI